MYVVLDGLNLYLLINFVFNIIVVSRFYNFGKREIYYNYNCIMYLLYKWIEFWDIVCCIILVFVVRLIESVND